MRRLASVQTIENIKNVPELDNLVMAKVLGWNALVKRGEYNPGDKIIYVEYDAILPKDHRLTPHWAFLETRKWRVKTYKVKGVVSDGLVLPLSILGQDFEIGSDVTELLGITKFDPETEGNKFNSGDAAGAFPAFIPRTDQTRIQTKLNFVRDIIERFPDNEIFGTLKIDGTSATYYLRDDELVCCSRNLTKKNDDNVYVRMGIKYDIANILRHLKSFFGMEFAIQGEIYGPGIQKNLLDAKDVSFMVFDLYNITGRKYFSYQEMWEVLAKIIPVVPNTRTIRLGDIADLDNEQLVDFFEQLSCGNYPNTKNQREGIVWRLDTELEIEVYNDPVFGTNDEQRSFKVINIDYLVK